MTKYPQFLNRHKTYVVNDEDNWNETIEKTDWFIWDFDLTELKTMKRIQVRDFRDKRYNDEETFCTLQEYINIAKNGKVGIYPEIKHGYKTDEMLAKRNQNRTSVDLILQVFIVMNIR